MLNKVRLCLLKLSTKVFSTTRVLGSIASKQRKLSSYLMERRKRVADRQTGREIQSESERKKKRERQRDRERDRQTERDTERERQTERQRQRQRHNGGKHGCVVYNMTLYFDQ